jgi:hypothetical protein
MNPTCFSQPTAQAAAPTLVAHCWCLGAGLKKMTLRLSVWGWCSWVALAWTTQALTLSAQSLQHLHIHNAGLDPGLLVCARQSPASTRPPTPTAEASDLPADDEVAQALQDMRAERLIQPTRQGQLLPGHTRGWRLAIWGDSHMAAAFFSDHLARKLLPADGTVSSRFVHAGVGHGGVRGLVRKTCLSGEWGREMAYAHADAAAAPGPGMTSLVAKQTGATLALDLRDAQAQARHQHLQLLYHGDGAGSTQLAISVDGEAEIPVTLNPQPGPNALVLQTSAALSTLQLRVVDGAFRFQGLKLAPTATPTALHLDLFAYPGATVAGWGRSDLGYLASWFTDQSYDLALFAYGTNEGNDPRFNETTYREALMRAVGHFRQVFQQTPCVLIAPGDRGVRVVRKNANMNDKKQARQGPPSRTAPKQVKANKSGQTASNAPTGPSAHLLKYARIHQRIGHIQAEVAAQHGCQAWSMQTAMGGAGSAYSWARKNPPLMAPDLIHFTPAGYRELANSFAADFGLSKP